MSEPSDRSTAQDPTAIDIGNIAGIVMWFAFSDDHTVVKDQCERIIQVNAANGYSIRVDYDEDGIKQIRNKYGSPLLNGSEKSVYIDETHGVVEIDRGSGESEIHYVGSHSIYKYRDGSKEVIDASGAVFKFRQNQDDRDGLIGIYTIDGRLFRVHDDHSGKYQADCLVRPGDSLFRIAEDWLIHSGLLFGQRYSEPISRERLRRVVEEIAAANGIGAPDDICAGQKLSIPASLDYV